MALRRTERCPVPGDHEPHARGTHGPYCPGTGEMETPVARRMPGPPVPPRPSEWPRDPWVREQLAALQPAAPVAATDGGPATRCAACQGSGVGATDYDTYGDLVPSEPCSECDGTGRATDTGGAAGDAEKRLQWYLGECERFGPGLPALVLASGDGLSRAEIESAHVADLVAVLAELARLRAENERLRDDLLAQWQENHAEHCDSEWPHPEGRDCYWPLPAILSGETPPTEGADDA